MTNRVIIGHIENIDLRIPEKVIFKYQNEKISFQ